MSILNKCSESLSKVKEKKPLVHHITNYVTVNDCANITLAIGGSPVMADDIKEAADMTSIASSLVINIGTLNHRTVESMIAAGRRANELNIPIIFDPVGVGATPFRNEVAAQLLKEVKFSVIRGNMSEIKSLLGLNVKIKGVDSVADESDGKIIALQAAKKLKCIVAITGKKDAISDGNRVAVISNGHEMLADVTGTGCMTTSLVGTFCGAVEDKFIATVSGILTMGLCGERAQKNLETSEAIGKFKVNLFDEVYNLKNEVIEEEGKVDYE